MSVAIIPMAHEFGWSPTTSGLIQSSFFWGYMLTQIPGGYITSLFGGRRVLPAGVGLWSAATAVVPFAAGTIPGIICPPDACIAHSVSHAGGSPTMGKSPWLAVICVLAVQVQPPAHMWLPGQSCM